MVSRGAFILFEGVDRCGKTTQAQKLVESLTSRGRKVELWRFPDRTTATGQIINEYLQSTKEVDDATIHKLFADNRREKQELLERKLGEGVTLVIDRYAFSGVAFTAAKKIDAAGLSIEWCKEPDEGLPAPDLVFFLDIEPKVAAQRGGFGGERYEKIDFQETVRKLFLDMKGPSWTIVDATKSIEEISVGILEQAEAVIAACAMGRAMGRLW